MVGYARNPNPEKSVRVYGRNLRISTKDSTKVCRAVSNTSAAKAMNLLLNLATEKVSLEGKYYTKSVGEMITLLKLAESNAEAKGLDPERMLVHASAHQGFTYQTPRRFKLARRRGKMTNLQIVLEER
jgi:large subunit ribosomal protein L22